MKWQLKAGWGAALCFALCGCGNDASNAQPADHFQTDGDDKDNSGSSGNQDADHGTPCPNADLQNDARNCGQCGFQCLNGDCRNGVCECHDGYFDDDNDGACESYHSCTPGAQQPCYVGNIETAGVGRCKSGIMECIPVSDGYSWGACEEQVLPAVSAAEFSCAPGADNDCNGIPDDIQDEDGDGYSICRDGALSDCCDSGLMCNTSRPDLVHPGQKYDCRGNHIDDNCDGITDDGDDCPKDSQTGEQCPYTPQFCSDTPKKYSDKNTAAPDQIALALIHAMDLCADTRSDGMYGKLLAYSIDNGNASIKSASFQQIATYPGMKDTEGITRIPPQHGNTVAVLSTGLARDAFDLKNASYGDIKISKRNDIPQPYKTAHDGKLQSHKDCGSGFNTNINDLIHLHIKLQAPEKARGFRFDFRFFTLEYPYYLCTEFNDFFVVLLTDEQGKPLEGVNEDGNISFDKNGNPVSVNNGFFTSCTKVPCISRYFHNASHDAHCPLSLSCVDNACVQCEDGVEDVRGIYPTPYTGGSPNHDDNRGGGTAWLTTQAPVTPGQIFNLDFYIWDTGDQQFDSTVLIDNFNWTCSQTDVGTDFATGGDGVN